MRVRERPAGDALGAISFGPSPEILFQPFRAFHSCVSVVSERGDVGVVGRWKWWAGSGHHSEALHVVRATFHVSKFSAYRKEFDVVLFWSLDRFSREGPWETQQHLQRLISYNVSFKSLTEQFLDGTGPFREAIIAILAAIAKQERVRLSERVLAGLERARAKGRVGGRRPVNRKHDKDAAHIRRLRDDGQSYQEIAEELGRSKATVARICQTLGCASITAPGDTMMSC